MEKTYFVLAVLPILALLVSWPVCAQEDISLENRGLRVVLSKASKYGVAALVHKKSGNDLISAKEVPATIFRLDVSTSEGVRRFTQTDAEKVTVVFSKDGSELALGYELIGGLRLKATVKVRVNPGASDSTFHIEAVSEDDSVYLQSVRFPFLTGYAGLGEAPEDDVFLAPVLYGELFQNPYALARAGKIMPAPGHYYPGGLAMQFAALYDPKGGFYMACEDPEGNVKALTLEAPGRAKDQATLSYGHFFPEEQSRRFANDFPIRVAAFDGDWYDAADIYRKWAITQAWCARTLEERQDYPNWYKEPVPVFDYRNYPRQAGVEFIAPHECEAAAREFVGETPHPYVLFAPGWEKLGPWAGPEFFPPRGGEESFARMISSLHERGNLFMHMFCCAMWVHPVGKETELYLTEGAPNRMFAKDGQEFNFDKGLGFLGKTHRMCPGTEAWQSRVEKTTEDCLTRGIDLYQLDTFPISNVVPCHGPGHPHPMGWGRWFGESWKKLCERARRTGRSIRREAVFSAEEMCEIYIPYFETYLTREERRGKAGHDHEATLTQTGNAPIFQYVYHDYITAIGDFAEPCSLGEPKAPMAIARQFTRAKHIGVRIPSKGEEITRETKRDLKYTLDAVATLYALGAERTLFARMIRPPKAEAIAEAGHRPIDWRTSQPAIGAFESSGGEITILLSNSSETDVPVRFEPPREGYAPTRIVANGKHSSMTDPRFALRGPNPEVIVGGRVSLGIVYARQADASQHARSP